MIYQNFTLPLYSFHRTWDGGKEKGTPHFHSSYELNLIVNGDVSIITDDCSVSISQPCMVFHAPFSLHNLYSNNNIRYESYVFHFAKECTDLFGNFFFDMNRLYQSKLSVIPLDSETFEQVMPLLTLYDGQSNNEKLCRIILAGLLEFADRLIDTSIAEQRHFFDESKAYIGEIVEYIGKNYSNRITVEEISQHFFISRSKIDRDFRSVMKVSIKQYLIHIRISNAVKLMLSGKSITAVTEMCGFVHESHFIRSFTKHMGVSPYKFYRMCVQNKI